MRVQVLQVIVLTLMLEVARMRKTSALANSAKSKVTNLNRSSYNDQLFVIA